jgi:hypothetical protein
MPALVRQIFVFLAVIAMVTVNVLANALPLNGQQTGAIASRFDVLFAPAAYVFSIWGLIYIALLAYAIYQLLPAQRDEPRLRHLDGPVVLSCLANGAWLFAWHYEHFELSLVLMLILLAALVSVYLRLDLHRADPPGAERWLVDLPFSIYLGWISVATIANTNVVLHHLGWSGGGIGELAWMIVMLCIALGLAGVIAWARRDTAYLAVLVWAFIGIAVEQGGGARTAAALAAGVAGGMMLLTILGHRRGVPQPPLVSH